LLEFGPEDTVSGMKPWRGRRSIDWSVTMATDPPRVRLMPPTSQSQELVSITSALVAEPSAATVDHVLRRVVEFARSVIRLERTAIFLLDLDHQAMVGTWGTNALGETVDEHDVMYDHADLDREVFARAGQGFAWTAYEDCPLITQEGSQTRIIGKGWVACTPIIGPGGPIGILFNDTAITHATIDEARQARAAVLCSLLGRALEPWRHLPLDGAPEPKPANPLVRETTRLLVADPTLSCATLAERLGVSATTLARTFKREAKVSVVDHRNELRLARFLGRVDAEGRNLLEAALDAGFGSYAQFHRVFRARFGQAPREYLLDRRLGDAKARE
jgi:AraC-like DNA-binding protein